MFFSANSETRMGDCDDLKRPLVDNGDICPLKRPKVEPVKQEKDNNPFCPESQNPGKEKTVYLVTKKNSKYFGKPKKKKKIPH